MYDNLKRSLVSGRSNRRAIAIALLMAGYGLSNAFAIDTGAAQLQLQPLPFQDARVAQCQQRYAENIGQCAGGPICYSDNMICDYAPADPSCGALAFEKYQRCLARPPRLSTVNQ